MKYKKSIYMAICLIIFTIITSIAIQCVQYTINNLVTWIYVSVKIEFIELLLNNIVVFVGFLLITIYCIIGIKLLQTAFHKILDDGND